MVREIFSEPGASTRMRCFLAIPIPAESTARLAELVSRLKSADGDASAERWTRPEQWHFTLAFFGSVSASVTELITTAIDALERPRSIAVELDRWGAFPDARHAKVSWLGPSQENRDLSEFAQCVRSSLAARGIPFDGKPFVPHLTLSRLAKARNLEQRLEMKCAPLRISATELALYESRPGAEGSEYRRIRVWKF